MPRPRIYRLCGIEGCELRHYAKGLCDKHRKRKKNTGSVELLLRQTIVLFRKKWKLSIEHEYGGEPCWEWTAYKNRDGYGQFNVGGQIIPAHRWSYEYCFEPIPSSLQLDHLCRVRHCVNPSHLEPVTRRENIQRGKSGQFNAQKTHCPQGHPYEGVNSLGYRRCLICGKENMRKYREAKRRAA